MKSTLLSLLFLLGSAAATAQTTADHHPDHPAESRQNLLEVIHHIYLWHYDQSFFTPGTELEEMPVHFRTLEREVDAHDESVFAELYLPAIQMLVELKRSNYHIVELDLPVRDEFFKIRHVDRVASPPAPLSDYKSTIVTRGELRDWFATKSHRAPPMEETLRARIRETLLENQFQTQWDDESVHIFYVAPLSTVSNDIWILHENTNQLLQFSADMDLNDHSTWTKTPLRLRFHQLDPNLILTPDRNRGGAPEIAKDFVGRALFNCVVLGNRIEVLPEGVKEFLAEKAALDQR